MFEIKERSITIQSLLVYTTNKNFIYMNIFDLYIIFITIIVLNNDYYYLLLLFIIMYTVIIYH